MVPIRSSFAAPQRLRILANWLRNLSRARSKSSTRTGRPMANRNLGIRRSYINETTRVAKEILARKLQTIVFANSRLHTEVLLTYLQQANPPKPGHAGPIRGYRGGYLPGERREIERGLRDGRILGVVS